MVCRLTEQKGVDLVLANRDFFLSQDVKLVLLGAGSRRLEDEVRGLAASAPQKIALSAKLDEGMSHLIEAGSDFFVMPSLFEPCGLNQMYSQVYGTPPIVSRVGGLADTVTDADANPSSGTGLMCAPNAASLADALARSLVLFADQPRYAAVQQRGMARDFSWSKAAVDYEKLYRDAL
jgi:starch synthase